MHRVSARTALAALALVGLGLSGCGESQDVAGPRSQAPSFLVAASSGTWTTKAPQPVPDAFATIAGLGTQLYLVIGFSNSALTGLDLYDLSSDTWIAKAPPPFNRMTFAGSASIGGKLYVVGGCVIDIFPCTSNPPTSNLLVYDPATDTWAAKAPMPTARWALGVGAINGKLYAVGGLGPCSPCNAVSTLEVYDPSTDSWQTRTPMPDALGGVGAAVIDGKLYVTGGYRTPDIYGSTAVASVYMYDPTGDAWTSKAPMPTERAEHGAAALNGILYVMGGVGGNFSNRPSMVAYDAASDNWNAAPSLPEGLTATSAAAVGGSIYVIGTDVSNNFSSALYAFTPVYPFTGFFSPVDNPDIVNVAKAGSAIPVKFSLGSNLSLNILSPGSPSSAPYACGSGPTDAIEQTVTATASGLQYDPTANQYIYTWKTDKSWAGTCRKFSLGLTDGSSHVALFQFK